jgi:hypothetical protein
MPRLLHTSAPIIIEVRVTSLSVIRLMIVVYFVSEQHVALLIQWCSLVAMCSGIRPLDLSGMVLDLGLRLRPLIDVSTHFFLGKSNLDLRRLYASAGRAPVLRMNDANRLLHGLSLRKIASSSFCVSVTISFSSSGGFRNVILSLRKPWSFRIVQHRLELCYYSSGV